MVVEIGMQAAGVEESYIPDPDLIAAAQVALILGQPLLLTGEPGTGKSTFARYVANHLAPAFFGDRAETYPLHIFETKSTSVSTDLFYRFDNLRRFHAAYDNAMSRETIDYITFEALGQAILETHGRQQVQDLLPTAVPHNGPQRSVVLIDEVDKAPRDFPNDLLNEIDQKYFKIHELPGDGRKGARTVRADPQFQPIIILTSNSEKNLPAPFLRRCVFHHIRFPDAARLRSIINANLAGSTDSLADSAITFFCDIRAKLPLDKLPTTAELIQWVRLLQTRKPADRIQDFTISELRHTLGVLGKTAQDLEKIEEFAISEFGQNAKRE